MKRIWTAVVLAFLASAVARGQKGAETGKPDVFLVTIDTLRSDHLHCYGYELIQTPALDELAKQGTLFRQAFTPSPITTSSHVSIMTGLLPSSHGVTDFGMPLIAQHFTIAELLEKSGYQTAAFIGSVVLDSKTLALGLDRGFQHYDNFAQSGNGGPRWGRIERRAADVETRAEKWLDAHERRPRFVWIHFYDPHDPYEPPAPYSEKYKEHLYDGEIAYVDAILGRLLARLKQQNAYDRALIIVMSDHGEGLGEHHEDTHGVFLYDSTTHVPLLMKLPGNRDPGRVVGEQVRTIDVMPTIVDLLGLSAPAGLDGSSLRPLLAGAETEPRAAFGETDYPLHFGWAPLRSVRKRGSKFIEAPRPEFYDLHSDPAELRNSYEPWAPPVQEARGLLADLKAKAAAGHTALLSGAVTRNTIDELRELGYFTAADAQTVTKVPEPSLLPDPKDKIEEQNLIHSAMMASGDGRVAEARKALEEVLQRDDHSLAALSELGRLELSGGDYQRAADHLRHARELNPNDPGLALDLGQALYGGGDLAAARDVLQENAKSNPNQAEARLLLARVYFGLKQDDAAMDQLAARVLDEPGNTGTIMKVADLLMEHDKFAEAIEVLEPLADSSDRNLLNLLVRAYKRVGRLQDARRVQLRMTSRPQTKPQ